MFDFENLIVYQKALKLNKEVLVFVKQHSFLDAFLQNQLKRASVSILANIAEGAGRYTKADKAHFFIISRGSAFEVLAFFNLIFEHYKLDNSVHQNFRVQLSEIVKMLFALSKKY